MFVKFDFWREEEGKEVKSGGLIFVLCSVLLGGEKIIFFVIPPPY